MAIDSTGVQYLGKVGEGSTAGADYVFAVSDGMGGAMAGEYASKIAVEKITRLFPRIFRQNAAGIPNGFSDVLQEVFLEIHRALCYLGSCYEECHGMGATLSLCWFTPQWMYFGHIGDSRIYYLPAAGDMRQISEDDTYVGWLFRNGQINEREAKNHPRRNILQKALGAGHQFVDPQVGAVSIQAGDRFLLCTDGVTDGMYDASIGGILSQPLPTPAKELVNQALEASGKDNTTALVIDVH